MLLRKDPITLEAMHKYFPFVETTPTEKYCIIIKAHSFDHQNYDCVTLYLSRESDISKLIGPRILAHFDSRIREREIIYTQAREKLIERIVAYNLSDKHPYLVCLRNM